MSKIVVYIPLLEGRFNNHEDERNRARVDGAAFGVQPVNQRSAPAIPYGGQGSFLENFAMAVNPSLVTLNGAEHLAVGRVSTPVVMIYNIDTTKINCDAYVSLPSPPI